MTDKTPPTFDSRELMLKVIGEYAIKGLIAATGCVMVLYAVIKFLNKGDVTIEQVIIIAGLGYTAARETYFRSAKDKK